MATCQKCGTEDVAGQQYCTTCGAATSNAYSTLSPMPHLSENGFDSRFKLAGFWSRFLGYFIDGVIIFVIVQLPLAIVHTDFSISLVLLALLTFLYASLFIGYGHGQTLGMRAVGVRCVDEDGASEINYQRAATRAIFYGVLTAIGSIGLDRFYRYHTFVHPTTAQLKVQDHHVLILFVFLLPHLVDLVWVAWDKRNQTLHDKFSRTVVIKTK